MKIILKQITLRNFKGQSERTFALSENVTNIFGKNGSGKTRLTDSFLWLLFGKDHLGRSDFELYTLDNQGNKISKLDCEVEGVLSIITSESDNSALFTNEKTIKLKRIYSENWVTPKGQSEEVFKGNSTSYFINDVTVKQSEYNAQVESICSEIVFKSITNPAYFPNLSKDEQRAILFNMVGEISNNQIAEKRADFKMLLEEISGVDFSRFLAEIRAKMKRIKDERENIPARIDELKRTVPKPLNWSEIDDKIAEKEEELRAVEIQLSDESKRSEEENKKRLNIQEEINKLERRNQELKFEEQNKIDVEIQKLEHEKSSLEQSEKNANKDYTIKLARYNLLIEEKAQAEKEREKLLAEWREINAKQLIFKEGEFNCPACHRPLEIEEIEAKQRELTESFNKDKTAKLNANKAKGLGVKNRIEEADRQLQELGELKPVDVSEYQKKAGELTKKIEELRNVSIVLSTIKEYAENTSKIEEYKKQLDCPKVIAKESPVPQNDCLAKKALLRKELDELRSQAGTKTIIDNARKRIKELEVIFTKLNQELADLEQREHLVKEFEFAKNTEYETLINKMFEFVKFKLFRQQVDGQIVPTCECMVNGVPYSSLNNAMQIGAGLDIIRTISRKKNIIAPIWIDNRESVTEIPEMEAQVINLFVDPQAEELVISDLIMNPVHAFNSPIMAIIK